MISFDENLCSGEMAIHGSDGYTQAAKHGFIRFVPQRGVLQF